MNFIKLTFELKENSSLNNEKKEDLIDGLIIDDYLRALYNNNQIHRDYSIIKKDNVYSAFVTLIDKDSFDEKYDSIYVKEYKGKLNAKCNIKIESLGTDAFWEENCECKNISGYMLFSSQFHIGTPIVCIDCFRGVPSYRFPHMPQQEEYFHEVSWERAYNMVEGVWFQSFADRWAERQMVNPKSALSKIGRDICSEYEKSVGKPFYYYLFDADFNNKYKLYEKCPECGEKWRELERTLESSVRLSSNTQKLYLCDKCRLVSQQYWTDDNK